MIKKDAAFIDAVCTYYHAYGRHSLPWRKTTNPYRILVSEIMLQQTQVERVLPKYQLFIKTFPTVQALAAAPLADVLRLWQGLGYNRRAKLLHTCALEIVANHKGRWPRDEKQLRDLPGIGPYTAAAICAFAYNQPVVMIETNIRQVYIHHYFRKATAVSDKMLEPIIKRTISLTNARDWYAALMDYGNYLKRTYGNNTHQSRSYQKQTPFKGSKRQLRGAIIRFLTTQKTPVSIHKIKQAVTQEGLAFSPVVLEQLCTEGLLKRTGSTYALPTSYQ
jgi:A/G-specific adenine glycosylase